MHIRSAITGPAAFLVLQTLLLASAVGVTQQRLQTMQAARQLPVPRREPVSIEPVYDRPDIVTDEQLREVLWKLRPRLRHQQPKINHVDHALRFWGVEATFADPECLSGKEMLSLLLDHRQFAARWGEQSRPLLVDREKGIAFRTKQGLATASHVDHSLAGLAELGIPLDHAVHTPNRTTTLRSAWQHALQSFSLNQAEYEWSALALALYLPDTRSWMSAEGQTITFDRIARRIMREPPSRGVCFGHHRLHTLVMLLRIDEQQNILGDACRQEILTHLQGVTARLVRHQHAYGYWDGQWPYRTPGPEAAQKELASRLLSTGHALEWWSLAPREVHPPRETLVRAGQWLSRTIREMDDTRITENYTFLTHAGRALSLWRSVSPGDVLLPHTSH